MHTKMRQSERALCRIQIVMANLTANDRLKRLEFQLEIFLAEIELHRLAFFAAFPDRLKPLRAARAVGRLVPDERHFFTRFNALSDIEIAVFLAVLRNENFR